MWLRTSIPFLIHGSGQDLYCRTNADISAVNDSLPLLPCIGTPPGEHTKSSTNGKSKNRLKLKNKEEYLKAGGAWLEQLRVQLCNRARIVRRSPPRRCACFQWWCQSRTDACGSFCWGMKSLTSAGWNLNAALARRDSRASSQARCSRDCWIERCRLRWRERGLGSQGSHGLKSSWQF